MSSQRIQPPLLGTLFAGIGFALLRPRIWLLLTGVSFLLAWAVSAPVRESAQQSFGHVVGFADEQAGVDAGALPRWWFDDWERLRGAGAQAASAALAPLLLLASLFGLIVTAGWMEAAVHRREQSGSLAFLAGGGRHFFPFLRLWAFALAGYALVTWLVYGLPGEWLQAQFFPDGNLERAQSENSARWFSLGQSVVYVLGLLKIEIIIDLARAQLVVRGGRSAGLALLRGMGFWLRRWVGCLVIVSGGLAFEALLLLLVAILVQYTSLPLWILVIALPAARCILRGGRYVALALYLQQLVQPQPGAPATESARTPDRFLDEGSTWGGAAENS